MVRIVSVSSIGQDDNGRYFSDREVDGIVYEDLIREEEKRESPPVPNVLKASVLKGGRKSQ